MDALNKQVGGEHYKKLEIQPLDFIVRNHLEFTVGNVVKYLVRDKGNRLEDLEKAYHYIELGRNFLRSKAAKDAFYTYALACPFFKQFKNGKKYAQIVTYAFAGDKPKAKELLRKFINSGDYSEV